MATRLPGTTRDDFTIVRLGDLADVVQAVDTLAPELADRPDVAALRGAIEALRRAVAEEMGPSLPPALAGTAAAPPWRTCASPVLPDTSADTSVRPTCEGCGGPLSEDQLSRGAKACSGACRARASRERVRARRLDALDAAAAALAEARQEIARG